MSKLLGVLGATGQQGGSIIRTVLADPVLSKQYKIRAFTRNPAGNAGKELATKGVEVVKGDPNDKEELTKALKGVDTLFSVTNLMFKEGPELIQGKSIADAAVAAGVKYIIYSSLVNSDEISKGKYKVPHFTEKAEVEAYIRQLPLKSAFYRPASFFQNYISAMAPKPNGDGTYTQWGIVGPKTRIPLLDIEADAGNYAAAILADPEKYEGKQLTASWGIASFEEISQIISKATGKQVTYKQIPVQAFLDNHPSKEVAKEMAEMMLFIEEFGYYGPDTDKLVEAANKKPLNPVATPEQFFSTHTKWIQ